MNRFLQDIRFAIRQVQRAPGFATTAVLTLALSVGVATAVFCVIDAVILRPLPYAQPDRIVALDTHSPSGYTQPASWPSFQDERTQQRAFSALAGYISFFNYTLQTQNGEPVQVPAVRSTDNLFQVFGVPPLLGRTYLPGEEEDGRNRVAVLSYEAWQKYFNGDANIVGQGIKLNGQVYTAIGVMPAGFRFPLSKIGVIYTPHLITDDWMHQRGSHWLSTVARLRDGVSMAQAQADMTQVFANIGKAYPDTDSGRTIKLLPLAEEVTQQSRGPLWTLLAAVLAVLAIGCVNVAGLLLARGVKREREMAMRSAVGAGRARLIRQVLSEGLLVAMVGAAGGAACAWVLLQLMRSFLIHALDRGTDIQLNWAVLLTAVGTAAVVTLAASLYPPFRMAAVNPADALKSGSAGTGTGRAQHRLRAVFVISQVALTLVLLVVSGMLMRMIDQYRHADFGFDPDHIVAIDINFSPARYQGRDVVADLYQPLFERVRQIPGVEAVGAISLLPIEAWGNNSDIHIAGQPPNPPNQEMLAENRIVSTGYFDVFGISLREGRKLTPSLDGHQDSAAHMVVNERFVRKFLPNGGDVVGKRLDDDPKQANWSRIVGVVGNVRQDIFSPPLAERDWLMNSVAFKDQMAYLNGMSLVVRTSGDPHAVIPAVRRALHDIDPTIPFAEPRTMRDVISRTLIFQRMESWLFGVFAGLALVLALVGLYGLLSHEVELGTRDIGVRMALGASRASIVSMVMRRVAWMLAAGAAAGLALTLAVQKVIDMVIYMNPQKEFGILLSTAGVLIAAGALASLIPARRAASIEPMQALRTE